MLAAGQGRRLGHDKSITEIAGQPVLAHPLRPLLETPGIGMVVVTVRTDVLEPAKRWLAGTRLPADRIRFIASQQSQTTEQRQSIQFLHRKLSI